MASIKDVAKLAGVSWMTVSRVINQPEKVGDKTKEKVQQAIQALNYVPFESAKKMRSRGVSNHQENTIVILGLEVATTPFSVEMIASIEETLQKFGWQAVVINTFERYPSDQTIDKVLAQHPAGVIFCTMGLREVELPERLQDFDLVLANCVALNMRQASYIPNDMQGQYDSTKAVLASGARRLLYLTLPSNVPATAKRLQGFEKAIYEFEQANQTQIQTHIASLNSPVNYRQGIDMIRQVEATGFEFEAVVCGNDRLALVVQMHLLNQGYKIPEKVSVVGYDNMVDTGELFVPALTTVELPHRQIGEQAALHIIEQRQHQDIIQLECPFIARDSLLIK